MSPYNSTKAEIVLDMPHYSIKADTLKNRLYLSFSGFFEHDRIDEIADLMRKELQQLKPGYTLINDISGFKPTTEQGVEEIKKIQLYLFNHGLGKVVRVVGESLMSKLQFERKSKEVGYNAHYAASVEDAERILDQITE